MKKSIFTLAIIALSTQYSQAQDLDQLLQQGQQLLNNVVQQSQGNNNTNNGNKNNIGNVVNNLIGNGAGKGNGLSNMDIVSGLREALNISAKNATGKLGVLNGFLGNNLIKVLMPPEAQKIEQTLRSFGMNKLCDNLITSMNRAAEDAAGKAVPIFVNAITHMSITDGLNILKGGNTAATDYLHATTSNALAAAFRPVIEGSLNKVGAAKYWKTVFNTYNKLNLGPKPVNTDLTGYVADRAMSGLFTTIKQEESNIRNNPAARVTSLLQKVFK